MIDKKNPFGRIPSEAMTSATTSAKKWVLPPITDSDRILSSAEKETRERRERLLRKEKETIETIDIPSSQIGKAGVSAKQMQSVYDSVQNDGFSQGHNEGFNKGHAEGYEAGRQQALMETRAQLVTEQMRFQKIAQALLVPLEEQDKDLEHMLLDIICTLTQSLVQRELLTDSSQIVELVKTAVSALPVGRKNIRICVNPDDLAAIETYATEQQLQWQFFGDATLLPGGCRVETPESRVDFSVSARLQTLLEQFVTKQLAQDDISNAADNSDER